MSSDLPTPTEQQVLQNPTKHRWGVSEPASPSALSETWLGKLQHKRVVDNDNDFLVGIAPASRSAISGVGKTTLAIRLAREFNQSDDDWGAQRAATLSATDLVDILRDEEAVPNQYSVVSDELQGTLSDDGADARRGMASSVIDLGRALATLRYRQLSVLLVTQSTDWIDQRVRRLLDALILIQEPGRAVVFDVYENDLGASKQYTEKMQTLHWDPLPDDDPDYRHLHRLKEKSASSSEEQQEDENQKLPKDAQMTIAKSHREAGKTLRWIANNVDAITYSRETIRKELIDREDD